MHMVLAYHKVITANCQMKTVLLMRCEVQE
jgi:hypothetical protein